MPARARSSRYADRAALQSLGLFEANSALKRIRARTNSRLDTNLIETKILADLLPHQREFVCNWEQRYLLYVGGLGSGKSYSSVAKAILLAFRSQGEFHIYLEPTYVMLNDIAIPTWTKLLDKYDIPNTMRISPQPSFTLHLPKGDTTILLRPLMNVERLVGINAASLVIDEADTVKQEVAEAALIKLQGRVRVGKCPQICFASTPEGRKFVWNFFEKNKTDDKAIYRADTRQNPYLDENYVKDLLAN
jgi:phage terminase large subunit